MTTVQLAYGKALLPVDLDSSCYDITEIVPQDIDALSDQKAAFISAAKNPIGAMPLDQLVAEKGITNPSIAIVISDHTRPVPDSLLVPWIVEILAVDDSQVSIIIGTGTHRPSSPEEIDALLGSETAKRFTIFNHDCHADDLVHIGNSPCGGEGYLHPAYVNADIKIVTGFIEPHFFAGFSGGPKGVCPGIAGFKTVQHFHRASIIADPGSTWSDLESNPVQKLSRDIVALCPPDFMVNVTLNLKKEITGLFCGHYIEAHREGSIQARAESTVTVKQRFPVVITTNSGYPLDQNFYQTVKGISAASRIVEDGGSIIVVSECSNGLPDEGLFAETLRSELNSHDLLAEINSREITKLDQWQVQTHLLSQTKTTIYLYSGLNEIDAAATRCIPITDIAATLEIIYKERGCTEAPLSVAVMPRGPLTIPTLEA
ncbi:MAG: nickel-dependent lactate racemase [Lentisphaeria bacterium]|nr:nickel-dependent lactate racemase [Lentisphaeria bacterium]NQZ70885.1 nickel-dependent lactate racemase [Lentisphaeria bacterium]